MSEEKGTELSQQPIVATLSRDGRQGNSGSSLSSSSSDVKPAAQLAGAGLDEDKAITSEQTSELEGRTELGLKRSLKSRHLTFVAIGGTIGTGIFLSVGSSVATAGAGGALVAYLVVGLFCLGVILTLGEMTALIPNSGAFATFGGRYLLGARAWGEAEYVLSLLKVLLIIVFIIVGLLLDWGAVHGKPAIGLSNWNDGPFYSGIAGLGQSFTYAFYSFGGVELVCLAAGEAKNPQKSVPRAIKATFARILIFYVMVVLVIGLCVNRNDERLFTAYSDSDVAASPITIVFELAGFGAAVHVVNAVLLSAVLSATNSCFFASSRMLVSLAHAGHAPKLLGWTTKSWAVPFPALVLTLAFSCLAFITAAVGSGATFTWLINVTGLLALLQWIAIAAISIRFRLAFAKQGRPLSDLPYRVPFFPVMPIIAIVLGVLMFVANAWAVTTWGDSGRQLAIDYVGTFLGLGFWVVMITGYVIYHKIYLKDQPLFVSTEKCDFETGAVWPRGGGQLWLDEQNAIKQESLRQHGRIGHILRRVKGSVY
ncbi:hypothetical protein OIO90_002230 [Microbotryomycetes sp. JL221]|nr:hypothetical protein OIO90_002230 [Microbotryomycetes sp. JL221]